MIKKKQKALKPTVDETKVIENLNDLIEIQRDQITNLRSLTVELSQDAQFNDVVNKIFFKFLEKNSIQFHEFLEFINEQRINDGDPQVMREVIDYVSDIYSEFKRET